MVRFGDSTPHFFSSEKNCSRTIIIPVPRGGRDGYILRASTCGYIRKRVATTVVRSACSLSWLEEKAAFDK